MSVDFADLHVGIDAEVGIADWRAGGRGQMARTSAEIVAGAFDGIQITVASGARHRERIGRDELVERGAMAVRGDVSALRLGDLQKVAAYTREADGLGRGRAFIGTRHLL